MSVGAVGRSQMRLTKRRLKQARLMRICMMVVGLGVGRRI
jgi:hypothetical protein